jgi:hypothetical protein
LVAHGNLAFPISFKVSKFQKSISPLFIFPNPPQIKMLLNGQILAVFLNLLPNSNFGSPSALYSVAVAGCYPDITMNC